MQQDATLDPNFRWDDTNRDASNMHFCCRKMMGTAIITSLESLFSSISGVTGKQERHRDAEQHPPHNPGARQESIFIVLLCAASFLILPNVCTLAQ